MQKALLVGTARNIERYLEVGIPKLVRVLSSEFKLKVFIVESDSDDKTIEKLLHLKNSIPDFDYVSLGNLSEKISDRVSRIRYCRNVYVNEIRSNPKYIDSDFIIVADLDGVNSKLKATDLRDALKIEYEWDGLMANQSAPYYDLYALRHDRLMPRNFLIDIEESEGSKNRIRRKQVWDKMVKIDSRTKPILVRSAFGGLAIYKRWIFDRFDYGIENSSNECEHVYINLKASNSGAKFYIVPALINSGWNEHSLSKYFVTRNFLRLKRRLK